MDGQKGRNGVTLSIQLKGLEHNTGVSTITSYAFILKIPCILQKHTLKIKSLLGEEYCGRKVQQKESTIDWLSEQKKPKIISTRTKLAKAQTGKQN